MLEDGMENDIYCLTYDSMGASRYYKLGKVNWLYPMTYEATSLNKLHVLRYLRYQLKLRSHVCR